MKRVVTVLMAAAIVGFAVSALNGCEKKPASDPIGDGLREVSSVCSPYMTSAEIRSEILEMMERRGSGVSRAEAMNRIAERCHATAQFVACAQCGDAILRFAYNN